MIDPHSDEPFRFRINACDYARFPFLAPIGDAIAAFFDTIIYKGTSGCPCCQGTRVIILVAIAFAVGAFAI